MYVWIHSVIITDTPILIDLFKSDDLELFYFRMKNKGLYIQ